MKRARPITILTSLLTAIALFFGTGPGHAVLGNMSSAHVMEKEAVQCQSICPPALNQQQKTPEVDEDDKTPAPLPFSGQLLAPLFSGMVALLISTLALQYLLRRPPDLLATYAIRRI